nr:hypothetical protein Itr_chr13CG18960 [Ipomoea trifida]
MDARFSGFGKSHGVQGSTTNLDSADGPMGSRVHHTTNLPLGYQPTTNLDLAVGPTWIRFVQRSGGPSYN